VGGVNQVLSTLLRALREERHSCGGSSLEKKPPSTNDNTDIFLGMVKLQPRDISIVAKTGTFLLWYDTARKRA